MGNPSRQKGDREERAVVNLHRKWGLHANRTLESGKRSDGSDPVDIDLYIWGVDKAPAIGECKVRGSGFKQIYDWLGLNDFLTIRADNKERIYCIPERVWKQLLANVKRTEEK